MLEVNTKKLVNLLKARLVRPACSWCVDLHAIDVGSSSGIWVPYFVCPMLFLLQSQMFGPPHVCFSVVALHVSSLHSSSNVYSCSG